MKHFCKGIALFLALLMLLCLAACADEEAPGDTSGDAPASSDEGKGEQQGNNDPDFNVQSEKNEVIIRLSLSGADDTKSYLRLVYEDEQHTKLTNIYAHHIATSGGREVTEIFRSLDSAVQDDVMVLLRWYADPGEGGPDRPILILFREYTYDRGGEPVANAQYLEYEFYYEAMPVGDGADVAHSARVGSSDVTVSVNEPWHAQAQVLDFLYEYEDIYERDFEQEPSRFRYDLVYSRISGEEKEMKKDLQQIIPFPWTRIRAALDD